MPAQLWLGVSADTDGDGGYDFNDHASSDSMVTEFSWALDHLDPGQTYYVIVAATDENDDTAHAYGSFTTLSQRTITLSIGLPTISGGPSNIVDNYTFLKVADLDFRWVAPPENLVYYSLPRHLDLALQLFRGWETSQYTICEGFFPSLDHVPNGDSDSLCGTWNTAMLADVDIDAVPAGPIELDRGLDHEGAADGDRRRSTSTRVRRSALLRLQCHRDARGRIQLTPARLRQAPSISVGVFAVDTPRSKHSKYFGTTPIVPVDVDPPGTCRRSRHAVRRLCAHR